MKRKQRVQCSARACCCGLHDVANCPVSQQKPHQSHCAPQSPATFGVRKFIRGQRMPHSRQGSRFRAARRLRRSSSSTTASDGVAYGIDMEARCHAPCDNVVAAGVKRRLEREGGGFGPPCFPLRQRDRRLCGACDASPQTAQRIAEDAAKGGDDQARRDGCSSAGAQRRFPQLAGKLEA